MHLFTFKTEIKIAAIQLEFAKDAPLYIAEGLYYLKKVHQEMLIPDAQMEETETILEAVRGLNEEERQIVLLRTSAGLKHREIAADLEMPLATVLSKYNRAMKKLKKHLREEGVH